MEPRQAKKLGQHLRQAREKLGISARELARRTELSDSSIVRIEQGAFLEPTPDTLSRIADALGINLADLYVMADYPMPEQLPSLKLYLRTRYGGELSASDVRAIADYADSIAGKRGVSLDGPAPGEDEEPETTIARRSPRATKATKKKPTTKGGRK
jgi:transcriptional regulator with XRE-family HTH domain